MSALTAVEVLRLALATGVSRDHANVMTVIAHAESGWDPNNLGDLTLSHYGSVGLWQVFTGAHNPVEVLGHGGTTWTQALADELKDPAKNAHAMHVVFEEQGFQAWSTYNNQHTDAAWASLLAQVTALDPTTHPAPNPQPAPAPVPAPVPTATGAVAVCRKRIADGTKIGPNLCLVAVREAFGLAANGHEPTAYAAWTAERAAGPNTHTFIAAPANVPGFFKDRNPFGHIVVCAGGNMCYTTDFNGTHWVDDGKTYYVSITSIVTHGGMAWLGWSETLEGKRVHAHV